MNTASSFLKLVLLAPVPEGSLESALHLGAQLAGILNTDESLPPKMRRLSGAPLETANGVLSFAREWCLERSALFYAVVLGGDVVVGSISLSHIDARAHCARTGYFLAGKYRGQGYGIQALRHILGVARTHGVRRVSGSIPEANVASRRIWEKCGVPIEFGENEITAILNDDG